MSGLPRRPARVRPRPLSDLYALLGLAAGASEAEVTGVTHDSRAVRPGDLYAALPGSRAHGAAFAQQAADLGAVAVLTDPDGAERAGATGLPVLVVPEPRARLGEVAAAVYGHPADALLLVGVTGTNGKTTTAYLLDGGLRAAGHRTGLVGTVETRIGDLVESSAMTTPEAPDLQALFAAMAEHGVTAASMEVSSHALAMGRVDGTVFDVALFTNLSQDHLDFHGSMEEYFAAKADLFTPRRARLGVVDVDDAYGRRLAATAGIPVVTVSPSGREPADWHAEHVELGPDGSRFRMVGPNGAKAEAAVRLPGPYNVANAMLAILAQVAVGVPLDTAVAGVAAVPGVPGRMEHVDEGAPFTTVVDFAHTPDAVETALHALREVTANRLFVVLGCGGDRDRGKRPLMGAAAVRLADVAVLTSDNPRSEDPLAILDEMLGGARTVAAPHGELVVEPDRAKAIAWAVDHAEPGDVVVVAGKGHEQGQKIGAEVRPFDDRVEVRAALRRRLAAEGGPTARAGAVDAGSAAGGRIDVAEPTTEPAAYHGAEDRAAAPSEETDQ
ncbi:UDP-N-acetylmuramoyl-L-alanyl-D-glutamate--2,6-diaminopimelate ligase [Yinghuangia seranimata]|uniref:UDP-N-acetylmuramoyl-L-alanyl-D-glutamate--2, 6-diaminopimelate ligase n=1 Tax=Yinghuangia seranimata TaxID=408067 RepID=UPI00248D30A6|nr:UDP-N-acetylmuramoyl-L-alanyl-D-glutamate--2,6-diaminopimelate ligase [Yinghuangia seranimata]MDI2126184.1 UDP-N-acetylmuramoyl-L-alanyl-D-glutamate--2,6-diaminopimelate ligase [Yinghuangia seranimata]